MGKRGSRKRRAPAAVEDDGCSSDSEGEPGGPAKRMRPLGKSGGGLVSTFFLPHGGGSARTLAELAVQEGEEESLRDLLAQLPEAHSAEKAGLRSLLVRQYGRWWAQLHAGASLLLHGYGSKHALLQRFAHEWTSDGACLFVNGLQPGLTARQVLVHAAAAVKQVRAVHYRSYANTDLLDMIARAHPHRRLYLILHNIDGPGLRDVAGQRLLSQLAALPNVHLAASVDHVNAPLLWDLQTRDRFGWAWHNATTYAPYLREVAHAAVPSLLVGRGAECSRQSARVVLASLSNSAREVFRLLADQQLDPAAEEQGVSFAHLFLLCRERFLVSNEMLLKAFLTEFKDHDLLQTKRAHNGGELLYVPQSEDVLREVLDELDTM